MMQSNCGQHAVKVWSTCGQSVVNVQSKCGQREHQIAWDIHGEGGTKQADGGEMAVVNVQPNGGQQAVKVMVNMQ